MLERQNRKKYTLQESFSPTLIFFAHLHCKNGPACGVPGLDPVRCVCPGGADVERPWIFSLRAILLLPPIAEHQCDCRLILLSWDLIALLRMHPTCSNGTNVFPYANATTDLCRVVINVTTTETSSTIIKGWLPRNWNQDILATSGGGIAGCFDYGTMQYGAQFGFASFGTNCGHNGSSGTDFFTNKPEVLNDFGYRAIHVEAVSAKAMVKQYYHSPSAYNYLAGCSTGGRNAFAEALWYPEDFDGILAGSSGINWLRIVAERGILARRIGWPDINPTRYVREDQWKAIQAAQISLFNDVYGVKDGVIDDPTAFRFNPEALRCGTGVLNESVCLTTSRYRWCVRHTIRSSMAQVVSCTRPSRLAQPPKHGQTIL